ncbi:unnamed protein product [Symbiodinium sp. CCMP2456]|nr:unnamed protein product [Symbiodinium sp. CCMP2456]
MKATSAFLLCLVLCATAAQAVIIVSGTDSGIYDSSGGAGSIDYTLQGSGNALVFGTYIDNTYTPSGIQFGGATADGFVQDGRTSLFYFYDPVDMGSFSFNVSAGSANSAYFVYELSNVDTSFAPDLGTGNSITTTTDNRFITNFIGVNNADGSALTSTGIQSLFGVGNANGAIGGGAVGAGIADELATGVAGLKSLTWDGFGGGFSQGEVSAAFVGLAGGPVSWAIDGGGDWSLNSNWNGGAPSSGGEALLGNILSTPNSPATISLDAPGINLSKLTISNPNRYVVTGPQTLTLSGDAEISVGGGTHEIAATITGSSGLLKSGGDNLILSGVNTYTGGTTIQGGSLQLANSGAVPGDVTMAAAGELRFIEGFNGAFAGNITGSGAVVLDNSMTTETVTFNSAKSISGAVNINGGTLAVSNSGALGTADGTAATWTRVSGDELGGVEDTGKLALTGGVNIASEFLVLGPRANAAIDAVHLTSSGANTWGGNIKGEATGSQYNIESTSGTLTLSGTLSAPEGDGGAVAYVFSGAGNTNLTGRITDAETNASGNTFVGAPNAEDNVSVIKRGSGTLTIGTATTLQADYWQAGTVVEGGTLVVLSNGANGGELWGPVEVQSGAVLDVDNFSSYSTQVDQLISGGGTIQAQTLALFDDAQVSPGDGGVGTLTVNGNVVMNAGGGGGGTLQFELGDTTGSLAAGQYTLISHNGAAINVSGLTPAFLDSLGNALTTRQSLAISSASGAVNLDVTGTAGSLTWTGANGTAWDKNTTQNWVDGGAEVFYDLDQVTFDDSAGANSTVDISGEDVYPSVITFNSSTGNTYTVTGTNGFGGQTPLNLTGDVTVSLGNTNTHEGDISLASGTTLEINGGAHTFSGEISGAGSVVFQTGATLNGANTFTGEVTINGGTVFPNSATAFGTTDAGTTLNGGAIWYNFQNLAVAEPMTLNGGSVIVGTGTLALAASAAVSSPVIEVNGGTLDVTAKPSLVLGDGQMLTGNLSTVSGNVTAGSGSTIRVGGEGLPLSDAVYVDATWGAAESNTTLVGGGALTPLNNVFGDQPEWNARTPFGNGGSVLQGQTSQPNPNSAPVLVTTVDGLQSGEEYEVWVNFWNDGSGWRVLAGDSESNLSLYDPANSVAASTLTYPTLVLTTEGNRTMLAGSLGTFTANASGEIQVYLDESSETGGGNRAWYDGLSVSVQEIIGATLTVTGDVTLQADSAVALDIGTPENSDLLSISGNLAAAGILDLSLDSQAPAPAEGDVFNLLDFTAASGVFDSIYVPGLGADLTWDDANLLTTGELSVVSFEGLLGDFNDDGVVNAADYTVWRDNVGTSFDLNGNGNELADSAGLVDAADYQLWARNYGAQAASSLASVPEPSALMLALTAGLLAARRR